MTSFILDSGYSRIRQVSSFKELAETRLVDGINALCWTRTLTGNYGEVVKKLGVGKGITTIDDARLEGLSVSAAGRVAIDVLLEDQRLLRDLGLDPVLDCIDGYLRDEHSGPISTDVYSFHADRATDESDTWLCTYHGFSSEGLRNDQARRRVDIPEIRAELLKRYGGAEDDGFCAYLRENCYDLHYASEPQARPFSFGVGNLWRIAVEWPGCPVPPCIHRAPETLSNHLPRLLLIS